MDAHTELEREDVATAIDAGEEPRVQPPPARSPIEEASFVVLESGKVRFYVRPRVEVGSPTSLEDVQAFSFTLVPRNRDVLRRLCVVRRQLPDPHGREKQGIVVDRVSHTIQAPEGRFSRVGPSSQDAAGVIEVACGTYAIASHRDHVHFLYELELGNRTVPPSLLRELRITERTSYVAAVSQSVAEDRLRGTTFAQRRFTPLDLAALEREGTEFVLASGGHLRVAPTTWGRS